MITLNLMLADALCTKTSDTANTCGLPQVDLSPTTLQTLVSNVFLGIGVLSVIFLILGGIRYAISGGDSNNVKQAKETILYAVIGLIISLLAFLLVALASRVAGTGAIQ